LDRGVAGVEVHDERLVVGVRGDQVRIPRGIAELRGQFVVRRLGVEYGVAAEQERGYGQARADNNEDCQRDPVRPAARPRRPSLLDAVVQRHPHGADPHRAEGERTLEAHVGLRADLRGQRGRDGGHEQ
jgi:hypothetical protein